MNVEQLLEPIANDAPSGEDVSASIELAQLMEARRRDRPGTRTEGWDPKSGPKKADWNKAYDIASDLIRTRTKDLTVAAYLVEAAVYLHGMEGLHQGIAMVRGILDRYWVSLYPEMLDEHDLEYRMAAMTHLCKLTQDQLDLVDPDPETFEACREEVHQLQSLAKTRFGQPLESLNDLAVRLDGFRNTDTVQVIQEKKEEKPAVQFNAAPPDMPDLSFDPESARTWLFKQARNALDRDPKEPFSYRMSRTASWSFNSLPDVEERPAPTQEERERIVGIRDPERMWIECEKLFWKPEGRFWLDLQWHAYKAFEEMGSDYDAVRSVLVEELRSLIHRFPELKREHLNDGTPAASAACLSWLYTLTGETADAADSELPEDPNLRQEAVKRAEKGDLLGALKMLDSAAENGTSRRAAFLNQKAKAEILLMNDRSEMALMLFEDLLKQADAFRLEEWEGATPVISLLENLISCSDRLTSAIDIENERKRGWIARLCRLDAARAMAHLGTARL